MIWLIEFWASRRDISILGLGRMYFLFNDSRVLPSSIKVVFRHVGQSANVMVDELAKQRVDSTSLLVAPICRFCIGSIPLSVGYLSSNIIFIVTGKKIMPSLEKSLSIGKEGGPQLKQFGLWKVYHKLCAVHIF